MRFPYLARYGRRQPIVPVVVGFGSRILDLQAVVDSGAEVTVFDTAIADILDIDLSGLRRKIETISGQHVDVVYRAVRLAVGAKSWTANVGFAHLHDPGVGLLGHTGFFDHFRVTLDYRAGEFQLEPYSAH